jgi:DNA helicase-2/ATP-dependent DNA helicase PcrA
MDVSEILDQLNDAQRNAVAAPIGNMLVLAGAGSGKTRVLVHRIAWLTQVEHVSPHAIMAVTFTNKAAKEMRLRIEEMLGIPTRGLWIGTFHGLAHRFLKAHWQEAGLPQNFQILDSDDQLRLIKRILKELQLDDSQWPPRQAQGFINAQKDEGHRAEHIDVHGDMYTRTMVRIYQAYQEACARGGMVDFAEILLRSHELWLKNPTLLAHYQQRFSHILVDEFQDTNTIQYAWLRVLAGNSAFMMAVGDDDQSIYGWRGAKIENIQRFGKDFTSTQMIRLEQNYRSTSTILQAANAIIENNQGRLGKELWTDGEKGELIDLYAAFNEQDEARYVVDTINDQLRKGQWCKSDVAVLYRSNAQSRVLEEALLRNAMPYRIYGGQRFYDRLEIKHAMAYLRMLSNRNDDAAFERVINTPARGIGDKTVVTLREYARDHGCSMWAAAQGVQLHQLLPNRAANAVQQFIALIENIEEQVLEQPLDELIQTTIDLSGLIPLFEKEKSEIGQARIENLEELVNAAKEFDVDAEEDVTDLQQFLDSAALDAGDAQADEFEDSIQLMTLHSAKGLEFPLVFMVGVEENLFPHKMSLDEAGRLEEERRLCYVGVTRAKERLFVSYAEARRLHGKDNYNKPSRFIREFPSGLLREVRLRSSVARPVMQSVAVHKQTAALELGIRLGQNVRHEKFGDGVVLQFEGQGSSARVQVNFSQLGSKWLVLQFAKLELL